MRDQSYTTTIEVASSPENAFNHINDVAKWWAKDVGGRPTEFEGQSKKLNDEFILRHGDNHYSKQKLVEIIPNKKIVWLVTESKLNWIQGNKQEWTGTKMIFEIVPKGKNTALTFSHEGLVTKLECYTHCVEFWDMIIKNWLSNFITGAAA